MINMVWKGDGVPNQASRVRNGRKYTPIVIVNHISMGTLSSMNNWFHNPEAEASSHFGLGRDGTIHQYVRLEYAAWTQGLNSFEIPQATAAVVREMRVNPNLYCISIEHEGYVGAGPDGSLTEVQFWTLCWLHKYIQSEVERIWGHHILFSPQTVIGHFQINPHDKPFCPGPAFPWARLYAELAIAESMDREHYEERIEYHLNGAGRYASAYAIVERVRDLANKLKGGRWAAAAEWKLMQLAPVMPAINYTEKDLTAMGIAVRVLELGDTAMGTSGWQDEAVRKLLLLEPIMKQTGLL